MKDKRIISMVSVFILAAIAVVALSGLYRYDVQANDSGTVVGVKNVPIVWTPVPITTTTYYYGQYGGTTGQEVWFWHDAEAIVSVDIDGTNTLTITPQFSLDGSNWADGQRLSEGWVLPLSYSASTVMTITNASGVTSTTTSTATQTTATTFTSSAASRSSEWIDYTVALSASGAEVFSFPVQGQYLRFKATTLTTGVSITPTIYLMLRNTGGN